jgi:hypothetical protein
VPVGRFCAGERRFQNLILEVPRRGENMLHFWKGSFVESNTVSSVEKKGLYASHQESCVYS